MFSLLKKPGKNVILKLFRIVTPGQVYSFDTGKFIDVVLNSLNDLFGSYPTDYYITGPYPDNGWKTKVGFLKAVSKKEYKNICHLILSSQNYSFSFENWLLNDKQPKQKDNQAILLFVPESLCDYPVMETFTTLLSDIFPVDYGFIFKLPENYLASTESKIKKGFFGSSASTNPIEMFWQQNITRIDNGFLKGIYPVNFINQSVINHAEFKKEIIDAKTGSINTINPTLYKWTLQESEIQIARRKLSNTELLKR